MPSPHNLAFSFCSFFSFSHTSVIACHCLVGTMTALTDAGSTNIWQADTCPLWASRPSGLHLANLFSFPAARQVDKMNDRNWGFFSPLFNVWTGGWLKMYSSHRPLKPSPGKCIFDISFNSQTKNHTVKFGVKQGSHAMLLHATVQTIHLCLDWNPQCAKPSAHKLRGRGGYLNSRKSQGFDAAIHTIWPTWEFELILHTFYTSIFLKQAPNGTMFTLTGEIAVVLETHLKLVLSHLTASPTCL